VVGGDSGELITAAHVLGVVHPPGYPLYTLLGKLFSLLPVGPGIAFRVNLLSAACDALGASTLCWAVALWTRSPWAGAFSAALFAFSPIVWPYAVTAEVFALNNLFAAGLVALIASASAHPNRSLLAPTALLLGLGLSNHHTLIFLGAPALGYVAFLERSTFSRRRVLIAGACLGLGLLPYLYLPLAAAAGPPASWGDPTTLSGFLTHLLRREYGTFRLASPDVGVGGTALPRIASFLTRFGVTTGWAGPLLAASSIAPTPREPAASRRQAFFWLATLAAYLVVFSFLANVRIDEALHRTVQERFWQQAVVVGAALAGVGLAGLGRRLGPLASSVGLPVITLASAAALVLGNLGAMDQSHNLLFRNYGRAVLETLPEGSILFVTSDEAVGSVRYAQWVEGLRPDVQVATTGQLTSPWFRRFARGRLPALALPPGDFTARELMDANVGRHPVFLVNKVPWLQTIEEAYHPWSVGLAEQVLPKGTTPELGPWVTRANDSYARFDPGPPTSLPEGSWERNLAETYWREYRRFAREVVVVAATRAEPLAHRAVVAALQPLADRDPAPEPSLLKNLGAAYQHVRDSDPMARERMKKYWRAYLASKPDDPDAAAMRTLMGDAGRSGVE
jgi:dolichyl-phosphate-mannose-protein mannosyltransferase